MTDHCYIAVKGSLHSTDSSVFGLTTEEIVALSKRFSDTCKEVINGVLIKGSPIQVINALGEIGYRVICSSGETEIVWTLRREVLVSDKKVVGDNSIDIQSPAAKISTKGQSLFIPKNNVLNENEIKSAFKKGVEEAFKKDNFQNEKKKAMRLGTKMEELTEFSLWKGSTIEVRDPESFEEKPSSPEKKVIINTNESSEGNPMSFKNLDLSKTQNFVTTYSETIAEPARLISPTPKKKPGVIDQTSARLVKANSGGRQMPGTCGTDTEIVLAEYGADSSAVNPQSSNRQARNTSDVCPLNSAVYPRSNSYSSKTPMGFSQNFVRNQSMPQRMRHSQPPTNQARRPVDRIGNRPEDTLQHYKKDGKIEIVNVDRFVQIPPDDLIERRIILNTNLSSERNPLSARNLEAQNTGVPGPFSQARRTNK